MMVLVDAASASTFLKPLRPIYKDDVAQDIDVKYVP